MREIIRTKLSNDIKIDKSYIKIHLYKEINEDLFICKLARIQDITKFQDENKDFKEVKEKSYPFVYIIIDLNCQIILIQEDSSVFRTKEISSDKLYKYLQVVNDSSYILTIDEITSLSNFWDLVENEKVYKLNLNIKSPNLFGGDSGAEELAKDIHRTTNATETNIEIINHDGDLKLKKSFLNTFLEYIASGGGRWTLNTKNGLIRSNTKVGKKICIDNIDNSDDPNLQEYIEQAISKVDIRPGDDHYESERNIKE